MSHVLLVTRGVVHVTSAYGTREVVHATTGASCHKGGSACQRALLVTRGGSACQEAFLGTGG